MSAEQPIFFNHAPHKSDAPIVDVKNISVHYHRRSALENISFSLAAGERVAVVGPNGAGKSTLFKVLSGLLKPSDGDVKIFGYGPEGHSCIAYVVQRTQVDWTFPVTVRDVVLMGRTRVMGFFRKTRKQDRAFAEECLKRVGLHDLAHRQISELSGGQQQRMFIARALAQEAALMLMDEPFTGLDISSQESILSILDELAKQRVTVVVATHDLNLAAEHFDSVMLLNRKLYGFGKPTELFTTQRLIELYGGHARAIQTAQGILMVNDTCCEGGHDARAP